MDYTFKSKDGVSDVHAVKWIPEGEPKAVFQIVHGMMEYIERYDEFARFLRERGILVAGHDNIGHGHTAKNKDDLGIFHTDNPSDVMVDDIYTHYALLKEEYPNVPYFIMGHSMGSYLLRKTLSQKAEEMKDLTAAIIMGTGTEADALLYSGRIIVNLVGKIKSYDFKSSFVKGLMFGSAYKEFDITGTVPEKSWLSSDAEKVKQYYSDDYCTFDFSVNGYKALVDTTIYDNKVSNIQKIKKDLPLLFISGEKDPVGGLSVGVKKAVEKYKQAGIQNIDVKIYEGKRHEVLNEVNRQDVYQDIYQWVNKYI